MLFMCWTREIGVIAAALAGMLLGTKAPGAQMIASVTFIAILMMWITANQARMAAGVGGALSVRC